MSQLSVVVKSNIHKYNPAPITVKEAMKTFGISAYQDLTLLSKVGQRR